MRKFISLFLPPIIFFSLPRLVSAATLPPASTPARLCDLDFIFSRVVTAAVGLIGLAVFIMLLVGGFKLITSGGDAKATDSARNTITFAIVGLAFLVASFFILRFIKFFTGVDVLTFTVMQAPNNCF